MLIISKLHTEEKLTNLTLKLYLNYSSKNKKKKYLYCIKKNFDLFFWIIVYECIIFYIKKNYNIKQFKADKINKIFKKAKIYNKALESFFIHVFLKKKQHNYIYINFLLYIFLNICKLGKNHLQICRVYFLFKIKEIFSKKYKLKYEKRNNEMNYKKQNYNLTKEHNTIEMRKQFLLTKDLKTIKLYLSEKILKANTLFSYKLIEQKNLIEQIYDHSNEANVLFFKAKNKIDCDRQNYFKGKKIKFAILLSWLCLILCKIISK
nr:hypothetical protein Cry52Nrm2_p032 [Cryptomonas curvata]